MSLNPESIFKRSFPAPQNLRFSRWLNQMRITRWVRHFHGRLLRWSRNTRLVSSQGTFIYHRNGRDYPLSFDARNHQFHAIYDDAYRFGYEPETMRLVLKLLSGRNGTFIDVGANWGYYSLLVAAIPDFTGKIFALEPNPRTFGDLCSIIHQAALDERVVPSMAGAGAESCELSLEEADDFHTGLTRLVAREAGTKVVVRPIDDFDFPQPTLIKIDAEGMELDILRGATKTLIRHKPFVLFESFLDWGDSVKTLAPIEHLDMHGYRCFMPVLTFHNENRVVYGAYGDRINALLEHQNEAPVGLVEMSAETRYLTRHHLNVFACHKSRLIELEEQGVFTIKFQSSHGLSL